MRRSFVRTCALFAALSLSHVAIAELQGRLPATPGGTDYQAVYDTVQDITWLANGNAGAGSPFDDGPNTTDGLMSWANAIAWADNLTALGHSDWRLPFTMQPDPTCSGQFDPGGGFPLRSFDFDCLGSELSHLFYVGLEGERITSIFDTGNPAKVALFSTIPLRVWSSTEIADFPAGAWRFAFDFGEQNGSDKTNFLSAWAVRDGDIDPPPTVRMRLDATGTSFFGNFSIIFDDTGDGLLQHEEIVFFTGVTGDVPQPPPDPPATFNYTGIAYVPPIAGISTASGTINPNLPCAQCWEFTPSNLGDVSDGWFETRWTYTVSALSGETETFIWSYTFDGTDGNPWSPGAMLSGTIQGILQPDGDTVVIESFGPVMLTRPGLADFIYDSIENDEFNAWPNVGEVPVMSFSGLQNNFRACPGGFVAPFADCDFGNSPGGGFLMSVDPSIFMGSWITAADGTGNAICTGGTGPENGCRVQDRPINLDNWSLTIEVPADDCTTTAGGCNPTGGHQIELPEGFVVPPGGIITQEAFSFVDPRVGADGRCDGTEPLVLFDGDLIIPPHICGSPEFEVLVTNANFDILQGTILNTMFPEVFVSNPLECNRPIIGDPQTQDIVVWQPTDSADVIEGHAIELTFDCGSSRGKTRGFSFYLVGTHIDFGLDFNQDPQAVTQAFIDLTRTKLDSLVRAVFNARRAKAIRGRDFGRLLVNSIIARIQFKRGKYQAASRTLENFIFRLERAQFDTSVGFNHEGNLRSRADNIKFTLDEKIIPFAPPPVRRRWRW